MNSKITDMNQSWSMEMERKEEGLSAKWFLAVVLVGAVLLAGIGVLIVECAL